MLRPMATRKPAASKRGPAAKPAAAKRSPPAAKAARKAPAAGRRKASEPDAHAAAPASAPSKPARTAAAPPRPRPTARAKAPPREGKAIAASARERRFNLILQTACLKAGTAAAISTISSKVPFLGKLAPVMLGSVGEALVLAKVQQQLVREIVELYDVELSDAEERGVVLLATAVNIGAQQISKATVEELIEQLSGRLYRPVVSRVLPLASVATEVAAAVAGTYAVGKRAQALCKLPGTGAKDLSDLLRSLSGIDQARLYRWTSDAVMLALKPFRGVLMSMIPGMGPKKP
jgi:uncharacterized protein (DUF697 family)